MPEETTEGMEGMEEKMPVEGEEEVVVEETTPEVTE